MGLAEGCSEEGHHRFGGCYMCCVACLHLSHVCKRCGEEVTHNQKAWDSESKEYYKHECGKPFPVKGRLSSGWAGDAA